MLAAVNPKSSRSSTTQKKLAATPALHREALPSRGLPIEEINPLFREVQALSAALCKYAASVPGSLDVRDDLISLCRSWENYNFIEQQKKLYSCPVERIAAGYGQITHRAMLGFCREGIAENGMAHVLSTSLYQLRRMARGLAGTVWPKNADLSALVRQTAIFSDVFENTRFAAADLRSNLEENFWELKLGRLERDLKALAPWPSDAVATLTYCLTSERRIPLPLLRYAASELKKYCDFVQETDRVLIADVLAEELSKDIFHSPRDAREKLLVDLLKSGRSREYTDLVAKFQG